MNPATVANIKGFSFELLPLGNLCQQFQTHLDQIKAGSRNSASDMVLINQMHKLAVDLGAACPMSDDEEMPKNEKTDEEKAEAANRTSLINSDWFELQKIKAKQFI
jgi:hypothetical protein